MASQSGATVAKRTLQHSGDMKDCRMLKVVAIRFTDINKHEFIMVEKTLFFRIIGKKPLKLLLLEIVLYELWQCLPKDLN